MDLAKRLILILALVTTTTSACAQAPLPGPVEETQQEQKAPEQPAPEPEQEADEPPPVETVQAPVKLRFSERHPKIYKAGRKIRTVAVFVGPIVGVTVNLVILITALL